MCLRPEDPWGQVGLAFLLHTVWVQVSSCRGQAQGWLALVFVPQELNQPPRSPELSQGIGPLWQTCGLG